MKNYVFSKEDTLSMKAIAVILMVIHHSIGFPEKLLNGATYDSFGKIADGRAVEVVFGNFGKLCVALFLMLSGYGMYRSYMNRPQPVTNEDMTHMIIKRIKNVYIKYWQILIIFAPIGVILGASNITTVPVDWIKNFLALDSTMNQEAWFLTPYILTMIMFPFIIRWFMRKHSNPWSDVILMLALNTLVVTVLISVVTKSQYTSELNGNFFYQKMLTVFGMLPMFMAGCYLAKYRVIERIHDLFDYAYVAKIMGIIIIVVTYILRQRMSMMVFWGWDIFDFIYAATFTIGMALILDGLKYVNMVLGFIGKYATGIWLTHTFFCFYYFQDFTYATRNPILVVIILLAITLLIAWAIETVFGLIWKYIKPLFVKERQDATSH